MVISTSELYENNRRYLERMEMYRQLGYDIDRERSFIIEKARPISGKILEAGTGKGHFTLALARAGYSFTSCDISAHEQRYARLNLAYYRLEDHVNFEVASLESLPYGNGSYDVIFAVNLLHHLASVMPAAAEMMRVLSSAGKIILADFNDRGLAVIDKLHARDGRIHEVSGATIGAAETIFQRSGFSVNVHRGMYQDVLVVTRQEACSLQTGPERGIN